MALLGECAAWCVRRLVLVLALGRGWLEDGPFAPTFLTGTQPALFVVSCADGMYAHSNSVKDTQMVLWAHLLLALRLNSANHFPVVSSLSVHGATAQMPGPLRAAWRVVMWAFNFRVASDGVVLADTVASIPCGSAALHWDDLSAIQALVNGDVPAAASTATRAGTTTTRQSRRQQGGDVVALIARCVDAWCSAGPRTSVLGIPSRVTVVPVAVHPGIATPGAPAASRVARVVGFPCQRVTVGVKGPPSSGSTPSCTHVLRGFLGKELGGGGDMWGGACKGVEQLGQLQDILCSDAGVTDSVRVALQQQVASQQWYVAWSTCWPPFLCCVRS